MFELRAGKWDIAVQVGIYTVDLFEVERVRFAPWRLDFFYPNKPAPISLCQQQAYKEKPNFLLAATDDYLELSGAVAYFFEEGAGKDQWLYTPVEIEDDELDNYEDWAVKKR